MNGLWEGKTSICMPFRLVTALPEVEQLQKGVGTSGCAVLGGVPRAEQTVEKVHRNHSPFEVTKALLGVDLRKRR